jgi:hypothetical protein
MSSFTSKTVRDLYEAYDSVYVKEEEVFLNQLLEEVTGTINSLVDEGWDFSDHSWEEIYESFVDNVLNPELDKINSFFTSLNEEVLNEEEVDNFFQENLGLLSGLARFLPGAKKVQQAVTTATKSPKPSIIQAPLVKPGAPAAAPAPAKPSLSALGPGVKPVKPSKPLPTAQPQQGGIVTQTWKAASDWFGKLGKQPSAATQASASSRSQAARQRLSQRSTTQTPTTPAAPSGTPKPSGQQGWPSIGLRNKLSQASKAVSDTASKVKTALTPGPKGKAVLKYGALPTFTSLATPALGVDVYNLATGRPSDIQKISGVAQGAYGNLLQTGARVAGKLGSDTAPGMYELGRQMKQAGAETQAKVETKRKSLQGTSGTGRTGAVDSTTGKPVYNSYEYENKNQLDEVLAKKGDKWYDVTYENGKRKETEVTPTQTAIDRYNRLKSQQPAKPSQPKPTQPAAKPPVPGLPPNAAQPGTGPQGNKVGQKPAPTPAAPAATPPRPAATAPAAPATTPARPSSTTSAPSAPAPAAPKPSPVAAYMKAAADARKSGDPAQMAKVRDMGMDIWRKSNTKLAAAADERARIRGTAQTDNPLMKDMRSRLPVTPTVQAPAVKDLGLGQQSLSQNQYAGRSPEPKIQVSKDAVMNKTAETISKNPLPKKKEEPVKKEAYDIVLDYLLSEGHADTLSEAHYVMMQMDAEHIQNIVEQSAIAARAAKVVDDQRQGYHGDTDAINKLQDATSKSIGRLKRGQGPVVTPGLPGV